ncbi:MAG: glyoxalase [Saprospiraceae bacterium]|nr:glyoxalase [Saprospiraceae bacterium]
MHPFHYAFKVKEIESTRAFYVNLLGCQEGRSTDTWIDFNFFGHQMSAHISAEMPELDFCGHVDGIRVPIPHFGCLVTVDEFHQVKEKLQSAQVQFLIQPYLRYEGKVGEQWTMFVFDSSGNPLEFKAFSNPEEVFAK